MKRIAFGLFMLTGMLRPAWAQPGEADTLFLQAALSRTESDYQNTFARQSRLFNGSEYHEYYGRDDEHPYFREDWAEGSVYYDGNLYHQVNLLFDMSSGQLITENGYHNAIQLVDEKVSWFRIGNHTFRALRNEKIPKGFYLVAYDSTTKVYMLQTKALQQRNTYSGIEVRFEEKTSIYLLKDGNFWPVKSKKSVLNALADQRPYLKKAMKGRKPFSANRLENICHMARLYDRQQP
ncbi:MAG: hypothetical protein ACOYXA_14970 [Bacteroidota bacterium]